MPCFERQCRFYEDVLFRSFDFCRTTLCLRGANNGLVSVRLLETDTVPKRIDRSSRFRHEGFLP